MSADTDDAGPVTVAVASAVGGLGAVMLDLFQKGDASAVFKLTGTINQYGHAFYPASMGEWPDLPVLMVGLILVVISVVLAFTSEARSRNAAFYTGASVLTVLMTLVPYDTPLPPPGAATVQKMSANTLQPHLMPASYVATEGFRLQGPPVVMAAAGAQLPVSVIVHVPIEVVRDPANPPQIEGRLFDAVSHQQWRIAYADPSPTTNTTAKDVVYRFDFAITTGEPQGNVVANLKLRVRATGCDESSQARLLVTSLATPAVLEVTLQRSGIPRGLGRLFERPSF